MTDQRQLDALAQRLHGTALDLLFVSAAITNGDQEVGDVPVDVFVDLMGTNALQPDLEHQRRPRGVPGRARRR